jgi:hypothetical protein
MLKKNYIFIWSRNRLLEFILVETRNTKCTKPKKLQTDAEEKLPIFVLKMQKERLA